MDKESLDLGEGLESALLDQRMRADRHKANFESLKAQHLALQESHQSQRTELETLAENYDRLAHKSQEIIQTLQRERDAKIIECEEFKVQTLTPIKLEQLKAQLSEECRQSYRQQVESLESEVERITRENNSLKYSHTFLKSEYETAKASHQSIFRELKAKHEAELSAYIEERKAILARNERDIPGNLQRIRQLQRKNIELQQKVRGLMLENEDLREQKEQVGTLGEQKQQLHLQQVDELTARIKTMEIEKSSQSEKIDSLQRELSNCREEQIRLSGNLTHAQREVDGSKRRLEDMEHHHSMEISDIKMKHLDECRGLEGQREQCLSQFQSCQAQLEAHVHSLEKQDSLLAEKDRQVEHRIQMVREKEWEKQVLLEREKVELEERLAELQQQHAIADKELSEHIETLEDSVRQLTTAKTGLESELELVKAQLVEKSQELQSLILEVKQVSAISRKYQTLLSDHQTLQQSKEELQEAKKALEENVREVEEELNRVRDNGQREQEHQLQELERERQLWIGEREGLVSKVDECQSNKQTLSQQLTESKATNKKLQKHYKRQIQELRDNLELLKAEHEQSQTENQALEKSLGLENQKLKRRVSDMIRKQKEFQFILHNQPQSLSVLKESNTIQYSRQSSVEREQNQDDHELL